MEKEMKLNDKVFVVDEIDIHECIITEITTGTNTPGFYKVTGGNDLMSGWFVAERQANELFKTQEEAIEAAIEALISNSSIVEDIQRIKSGTTTKFLKDNTKASVEDEKVKKMIKDKAFKANVDRVSKSVRGHVL